MTNGTCKLTGETGKFVKSHLLPKALTRPIKPGLPLIQSGSGAPAVIRRDSWYDRSLVTADGEAILAEFDDWAIKFLRKSKLIWSGWGPRQSLKGLYTQFAGTPNGIRIVETEQPEMLRLFFLSLLWRAAATKRPEFSEVNLSDTDLAKLQHMLIESSAEPQDFFPISLIQLSTRGVPHNMSPIHQIKEIPNFENDQVIELSIFRFYLDGLIIHFDFEVLPNGGNDPNNLMIIGENNKLQISTVEYENSFQRDNLRLVVSEALTWPKGYHFEEI